MFPNEQEMFPVLPLTTKKSRDYLVRKKPNLLEDSQVTEFIVSLHSGATRQIQDLQIH